jgi:hypothetical protein
MLAKSLWRAATLIFFVAGSIAISSPTAKGQRGDDLGTLTQQTAR